MAVYCYGTDVKAQIMRVDFFYCMSPRDVSRVGRVGSKHLYLLSHLNSPLCYQRILVVLGLIVTVNGILKLFIIKLLVKVGMNDVLKVDQ